MSYHDLFITTHTIPRTAIFNLPFNLAVICSRSGGWELWDGIDNKNSKCLAGEYAGENDWLILDVAGHVIVNSRDRDN